MPVVRIGCEQKRNTEYLLKFAHHMFSEKKKIFTDFLNNPIVLVIQRGKNNNKSSPSHWTTKLKFVSSGEQLIYVDIKCLRRQDFVNPYDFKNTLVAHTC